jgi:hypothetical protein
MEYDRANGCLQTDIRSAHHSPRLNPSAFDKPVGRGNFSKTVARIPSNFRTICDSLGLHSPPHLRNVLLNSQELSVGRCCMDRASVEFSHSVDGLRGDV